METLHHLLGTNKRNPFIEVLSSHENPDEISVYYGFRLLEVVRRGKDSIEEKLLVGRLYNAGFCRRALCSAFDTSRKTLAKIANALKSGDSDRLSKAISGRSKKIPPQIEYYIRRKIREVYLEKKCHTNTFIRDDLWDKFRLRTNKETIRVILNDELSKMGIVRRPVPLEKNESVARNEGVEKPVSTPVVSVDAEDRPAIRETVVVRSETELSSNDPLPLFDSSNEGENDETLDGHLNIDDSKPSHAGESPEAAGESSEDGRSSDFCEIEVLEEIHTTASSVNIPKASLAEGPDIAPKLPLNCQNGIPPSTNLEKNDNSNPSRSPGSPSDPRQKKPRCKISGASLESHRDGLASLKKKEDERGSSNPRMDDASAVKSHTEACPVTVPERLSARVSETNPAPSAKSAIPESEPVFLPALPGPENCHHLGVLIFRWQIDEVTRGLGACRDMVRQWLACVLLGAVNVEKCDDINYDTMEYLIGPQIITSRHQRIALKSFATEENITELFRRNAAFIGADRQSHFLYDPHGVSYSGMLNILRCWLGGVGKVGKGYYLDFVHTLDGEPVMISHDDNYYDLRERFLGNIKKLKIILSGDQNRRLHIVVDRAIYDLEDLRMFRENNVHVTTWEKGYKKGQWDRIADKAEEPFHIRKYKNSSKKVLTYKVEYVRATWHRDNTFAKYIVLLTKPVEINEKPVELSVLCPDPELPPEQAITPILNRWIQEEDLLYEIRNMGINEITSYKYDSYLKIVDQVNDKLMENKKVTKLCASRLQLRKKLGLEILRKQEFDDNNTPEIKALEMEMAAVENQIDQGGKQNDLKRIECLKKKRRTLKKRQNYLNRRQKKFLDSHEKSVSKLKKRIRLVEEQIDIEPKRISRIEHLLENEFVRLNFMPKAFMDAVKIMARNIFFERHKIYRPLRDDFRRDHVVVRSLSRSHGYIMERPDAVEIMLEPTRRLCQSTKKAVVEFLKITEQNINEKYDVIKKISFSLYKNKSFGNNGKTRRTARKW